MPNHFVGREDLIADLVERLTSGDRLALSAEGLPGVGKTALAVALAHHRNVLEHFEDGVLWAGLGRQGDAMSALGVWAEALGEDVSELIDETERQQAVRSVIGQRAFLLVIDDAWELQAAKALRCGGPNCFHLLTTRDKSIARAFAGLEQTKPVPALDDAAALALLRQLAPEACRADLAAARQLAQAVGGLPLALELLGGHLAAPERSLFSDLSEAALEEMSDPLRRLQLAGERLGAPGQDVTLQDTVALSLEGMRESHTGREAERAFYALGAFAPKPESFGLEAARAVAEADAGLIALLVARNLLEASGERLALHQTLADVARTRVDELAVARHRDYYLTLVNEDPEDWKKIEAAYGQIKWAWHHVADEEILDWVKAVATYQHRRGLWRDAIAWGKRALETARAERTLEDEAALLRSIGRLYAELGHKDRALDYYQRALPIHEQAGDRAGLASTLTNIGLVYDDFEQREKALDFHQRALTISEEVGDRGGLAITLSNIGLVYDRLGQQRRALDFHQRALAITEEVGDCASLARILTNIGAAHYGLGQMQDALDFYERARAIQEEVGDRASLVATFSNIGAAYRNLEQWEKALDFYERALPIWEELGDRAWLATTLKNIGYVYDGLEEWEKALEYYQRALAIREELGDHDGESEIRYSIAMIYRAQGLAGEAMAELERVVEIDRAIGSPELESDLAMLAQAKEEFLAQQEEE